MKRAPLALAFALLLLAACGADGEPERPDPRPATSGIAITGQASAGIRGSL